MRRILHNILLIALLCVHFISLAKNPQETISKFSLENGLKVIVAPDHRAPVVVSQVWYKVGSAYEPLGLTGISHVLEHMMFKGTRKYKAGEFSRIIAENGGQENAFTSTDFTAYYQEVEKSRLPICLELEADRMQNLFFDSREFKKEIEVVKEERRMRVDDRPTAATYERFLAAANIASPYHHMPIGWMNDLKNLENIDVKKWYRMWYRPNNAIIVVVGDVEPAEVFKLVTTYFGSIPSAPIEELDNKPFLKGLGRRQVTVNLPAELPYLLVGYNVPSFTTAQNKKDVYTLEMIAALLSGDSGLLKQQLVQDSKVAVSAGAGYDLYSLYDGLFTFSGVPTANTKVKELEKAIFEQIENLKAGKITQDRLNRAKQSLIADKVYERDSLYVKAMQIGALESIGIDYHVAEDYLPNVKAVTLDDIKRVANQYFVDNQVTVADLKPKAIK